MDVGTVCQNRDGNKHAVPTVFCFYDIGVNIND